MPCSCKRKQVKPKETRPCLGCARVECICDEDAEAFMPPKDNDSGFCEGF